MEDLNALVASHISWLHELLASAGKMRDEQWSTSVAVGGEKFVTRIKELLGAREKGVGSPMEKVPANSGSLSRCTTAILGLK